MDLQEKNFQMMWSEKFEKCRIFYQNFEYFVLILCLLDKGVTGV